MILDDGETWYTENIMPGDPGGPYIHKEILGDPREPSYIETIYIVV